MDYDRLVGFAYQDNDCRKLHFSLLRYTALCRSGHVNDCNLGLDALYATPRDSKSSTTVSIGCRDYQT